MYGDSYSGTMYGDSFRGYKVWRFIETVQCEEAHIVSTMYGDRY